VILDAQLAKGFLRKSQLKTRHTTY